MDNTALIVVDHGSRREASNTMLGCLTGLVAKLSETRYHYVTYAHMELAPPTIDEAVQLCVEQGATKIVLALFFLGPGRHAREDIPRMAKEASEKYGVEVLVTAPLGTDERIARLLLQRAEEVLGGDGGDSIVC